MKIMFVEDDPSLRAAMRRNLEDRGFDVMSFASAEAAWDELVAHAETYEAVVTDYDLGPGMTGLEFVRRIRNHPVGCMIRVVVHSGALSTREGVLLEGACAKENVPFIPKSRFRKLVEWLEIG